MSDTPLDREQIVNLLTEVADELPDSMPRHVIVVVGGSLLAWHGLRDTTLDVDSIRRIDAELAAAVKRVADRHDLAPKWLNDSAVAFKPQTFDQADCDTLLDHPRLLVLGAPLRDVFLMKLYAARQADYDDLVALWPSCGFDSPDQAVADMHDAYPAAPVDELLVGFVANIARESETRTRD